MLFSLGFPNLDKEYRTKGLRSFVPDLANETKYYYKNNWMGRNIFLGAGARP